MKDHLLHVAEGMLGGVVGTALIGKGLELASARLPEPYKPIKPKEDAGAFMARQAQRLKPMSKDASEKLGKGLHVAYGSGWGLFFGLLAGRRSRSAGQAIVSGAAMGALVWLVGYVGWLPATGLIEPLRKQRPGSIATSLALHVGYGVATALPVFALERARH